MIASAELGPKSREQAWDALGSETFDVVVIGGGVTGAGAALDAATRGLSVALVEARDYASGTSSRSSKLFHGGLRYLEQLEFPLVREALHERELMLNRLAPHLVKPLPILYPLTHRGWERPYVASGLALYDALAGRRSVPGQKHLSRRAALREFPGLKPSTLVGAVRYFDAQTDDARHTLTVARTAAHHGAVVRNSTEVTGLVRDGSRVVGAEVRDVETGRTCVVRGQAIINCTGVWTDEIQAMSGGTPHFRVRASKGIHLMVPRDRIVGSVGLILRTATSVLFVLPWKDEHWLIGTTDTDWNLDLAHPAATKTDIDYLLAQLNSHLDTPIRAEDIEGVYAGLRPLLAGESEETSALSREHAVARVSPGLISIAGGKYTTYRVMAKDAVDMAVTELELPAPDSVTERVPLLGAVDYEALVNRAPQVAAQFGLNKNQVFHLLNRYGSAIHEVLAPAADDASLLEPLPGAPEYLTAEIRFAATHEGALHLEDVLTRRTRIYIEHAHRGVDSAAAVAEVLAGVLGWDGATKQAEIDRYLARVAAERESQTLETDAEADAARLRVPSSRKAARVHTNGS